MTKHTNEFQSPATVVGAGVTGLLVTRKLSDVLNCLIPVYDSKTVGALASGHAQCIIHRGYAYMLSRSNIVPELSTGFVKWLEILQELRVEFSRGFLYVFGHSINEADWLSLFRKYRKRWAEKAVLDEPSRMRGSKLLQGNLASLDALATGSERQWYSLGVDELTVRPTNVLRALLNCVAPDLAQQRRLESSNVSSKFVIHATGRESLREDFFVSRKAKPHWVVAVRGRSLPMVNVAFMDLVKYGEPLTIISHVDDGRVVWLMDCVRFGKHELILENLRTIREQLGLCFRGIDWEECEWKAYQVSLPDVSNLSGNLATRGINKNGDRLYHAYVERFTLAPVLASELAGMISIEMNKKLARSWKGGGPELSAAKLMTLEAECHDRWEKDDFLSWSEFADLSSSGGIHGLPEDLRR